MLNKELLLAGSNKPLEYHSKVFANPQFPDSGEVYFQYFAMFNGYDIKWNLDGVLFHFGSMIYDKSDGDLSLVGSDVKAIPKKGTTIKVTNVETGGTAAFVFDGRRHEVSIATDNIGLHCASEITVTFDPKPV